MTQARHRSRVMGKAISSTVHPLIHHFNAFLASSCLARWSWRLLGEMGLSANVHHPPNQCHGTHALFNGFTLRPWRWEQSQNALQAYVAFFGLLSLGQIPALKSLKYVELPYFVGLACLTIYIGAHRGLTNKVFRFSTSTHACDCAKTNSWPHY